MSRPWYPFYPSDHQKKTAHLSLEEQGALRRLLDHQWANGHVPDEMRKVANILGVHTNKAQILWKTLGGFFEQTPLGFENKRMAEELQKYEQIQEIRSRAGKKGVQAKAQAIADTTTTTTTDLNPWVSVSNDTDTRQRQSVPACPYDAIRSMFIEKCVPPLSEPFEVKKWNASRKRYVQARWREWPSLEEWETYFDIVLASDFLLGKVNGFKADFDWLMRPTNFSKVAEHKYVGGNF